MDCKWPDQTALARDESEYVHFARVQRHIFAWTVHFFFFFFFFLHSVSTISFCVLSLFYVTITSLPGFLESFILLSSPLPLPC